MKLLILGGTQFVGRHLTEHALARHYDVTLFNRGQHNTDLFPEVEKLRGNRNGEIDSLKGRTWDAVIDVSGYVPRQVHDSAFLLADTVEHYTFISSISAYAEPLRPGADESAPVATLPPALAGTEALNGGTYGPFKALCEQAAEVAMPGRVLNLRAGLIVGPYDLTDRFSFWVSRFADPEHNAVVVPAELDQPIQLIDGRDLAQWTLDMVAQRKTGIYNTVGPAKPLTFGEMLEVCRTVAGQTGTMRKVPGDALVAGGARRWVDLPFWLTGEDVALAQLSNRKALAEGLTFRPFRQIVEDAVAWRKTVDSPLRRGWSYEQEQLFLR